MTSADCPIPGCAEPALRADAFCAAHERIVGQIRLWIAGVTNDSGTTFDADRRAWGDARGVQGRPTRLPARPQRSDLH